MKLLVIHAWMKGNLGDVLQLTVLLSALRELRPRVLDLAGFPASPPEALSGVLALADRYVSDPFAWYWRFIPNRLVTASLEPRWKAHRRALFSEYDAVIAAPGPYLADYDLRAPSALADIGAAADAGRVVVLSGHSIGPLSPEGLRIVARATTRVSREPWTHDYLEANGVDSIAAADLAFLYPFDREMGPPPTAPPYRVVFLRSNNLRRRDLRVVNGALFAADREIVPAASEPIILATSDARRDEGFIQSSARHLGVRSVICRTVPELVRLISGATEVVSDRYHPAICGAMLGRPTRVLSNREPHKMSGLSALLSDRPLAELQNAARTGLSAVQNALGAMA